MASDMCNNGNEEGDWALAMKLCSASVLPLVLKAAIELDLLEIIARHGPEGQLSAGEIAAQLPAQNPAAPALLERIMRLLASYSVLTCATRKRVGGAVERVYGLAPVCRFFVGGGGDGVSLASLVLLTQDPVLLDMWHHLKDAVLEGGVPFSRAHGRPAYEFVSAEHRFGTLFHKTMKCVSTLLFTELLEVYNGFESSKSLVDVGGGTGASLNRIITKYPHIKGINFDLPDIVATAPDYPGVEHVGGDMFVSVPRAEAILLKWVLLDWSDDQCLVLLKNCYEALPDLGRVIIVGEILPDEVDTDASSQSILQLDLMEASLNAGKLRTAEEIETLVKAAGFPSFRPACAVRGFWVFECYKNI